jgi:FkbM family methyltransferase
MKLKKILTDLLGEGTYLKILDIYKNITDGHSIKSYAQEGEDLILLREFYGVTNGFYIDVGAYHPRRFSNTYLFYKLGWRGINIDARPGSMASFIKVRPRDINLEIPIADKEHELIFYTFNEPAVSGFLEELSLERAKKEGFKILKSEKLKTKKLSSILDENLPDGTEISFLSIDVEGYDLKVLLSNNWEKYRPKVILVEQLGATVEESEHSEISLYLKKLGYKMFAKTPNTSFFRRGNVE